MCVEGIDMRVTEMEMCVRVCGGETETPRKATLTLFQVFRPLYELK